MSADPTIANYRSLRTRVTGILQKGKTRAARAVERELVRTYWQVGDVLHRHLLANQDRAGYGDKLVVQLSQDLEIRKQRLYEMLKFRRLFPKVRPGGLLGWTHYRTVLGLPSEDERTYYLEQAEEGGWTKRELDAAIKTGTFTDTRTPVSGSAAEEQGSRGAGEKKLQPKRGELYTYRVAEPDDPDEEGLVLDLGFEVQHELETVRDPDMAPGTVVTATRTGRRTARYEVQTSSGKRAKLYTYRAKVLRVVDGDTLWVRIDLGFKIKIRQKLRLRGIDTPEMNTAEGRQAQDYVKAVLARVPWVIVTTTRPDKFDRYLSDVYYSEDDKQYHRGHRDHRGKDGRTARAGDVKRARARAGKPDPQEVARSGRYLNGELLEKGLAVRYGSQ